MRPQQQRSTTVLIVDDDPDIRDALVELVGSHGYRAMVASHGQEALEVIDHHRLDAPGARSAVLLDLMMPVMDGWRLMETLVKRRSPLKVIGLSASNKEPPDGLLAFFRKPVELENLLHALTQNFD